MKNYEKTVVGPTLCMIFTRSGVRKDAMGIKMG